MRLLALQLQVDAFGEALVEEWNHLDRIDSGRSFFVGNSRAESRSRSPAPSAVR